MPERSYRVWLWSLALIGVLADQATKYGVFAWLEGLDSHTYAVFQTAPEKRFFTAVPVETSFERRLEQRGFFLEVAFETDPAGRTVPHVNHGALFGFLREYQTAANGGFALISLLAAAAIAWWSAHKNTARDRWLCISLGLILAGTLGNFYDRLVYNGVRDFLHWNYQFDWPVFNVADCCLVVGACLLLLQAFFVPAKQPEQNLSEAGKESVPMTVGSSS